MTHEDDDAAICKPEAESHVYATFFVSTIRMIEPTINDGITSI